MGGILGKSKASNIQAILFFLAAGLVFVGEQFGLPAASEFGLACFGLLIVTVGIGTVVEKLGVFRIDGWTEAKVVDTYRGISEVLWGFLLIGLGMMTTAVGIMDVLTPDTVSTFWSGLLNSSTGIGVILAGVGLAMLLNGLIRALAGSGRADPQRLWGLAYALDRLAGVGTFVAGMGASAVGLLLLVAPGVVTATLEWLKRLVLGS